MARDFEIEHIKGCLHGNLHFERVGRRILGIEVFLVDGTLQEFANLSEWVTWLGDREFVSHSVNADAEWVLIKHDIEVFHWLA